MITITICIDQVNVVFAFRAPPCNYGWSYPGIGSSKLQHYLPCSKCRPSLPQSTHEIICETVTVSVQNTPEQRKLTFGWTNKSTIETMSILISCSIALLLWVSDKPTCLIAKSRGTQDMGLTYNGTVHFSAHIPPYPPPPLSLPRPSFRKALRLAPRILLHPRESSPQATPRAREIWYSTLECIKPKYLT